MPYKDPEKAKAYYAAYRQAHREHQQEVHRQWAAEHPEELKRYRQRYHAKRLEQDFIGVRTKQRAAWLMDRYGLTIHEYQALVAKQMGLCAICGERPIGGRALHVDHDHQTARVRGLLCNLCNRALGYIGDNPVIADAMARYLRGTTRGDSE